MSAQVILLAVFALTPLFFLPFTQDFYELPKWLLLVSGSLLLLIIWAIQTLKSGSFRFAASPGSWAFLSLTVAGLVSLVLASTNRLEAALSPFGVVTFTSLSILFLLGGAFFNNQARQTLLWTVLGSGAIAGLLAVYQFLGLGALLFPSIPFLSEKTWTPVGSTLGLLLFLLVILPAAIGSLIDSLRRKEEVGAMLIAAFSLAIAAGMAVTLFQFLSRIKEFPLLPWWAGWAILLEMGKSPSQALAGVGAENFLSAFTQGRPIALNATNLWNIRFATSSSLPLHLTTTLGVLGGLALITYLRSLSLAIVQTPRQALGWGIKASLLLGLVVLLLAPPNLTVWVIMAALLLVSEGSEIKLLTWRPSGFARWLGRLTMVMVLGFGSVSLYTLGRAYAAEVVFFRSLKALEKNEGTPAYNLQVQAALTNPAVTRFHIALSQTSLALANALVTQASATEGESRLLSDSDRQTVAALLQQAIREAKIAVTLSPVSVLAWENLALLYQSISGVAQGASQWAVASYQRAIQLDPANPLLRLRLGGVYVGRGELDRAQEQYLASINLKSDCANCHYNLAFIYGQKQAWLPAAVALKITQSLVLPESPDAVKIATELAEVVRQLTLEERRIFEQLQVSSSGPPAREALSPLAEPRAILSPQLVLPPEASPPAK